VKTLFAWYTLGFPSKQYLPFFNEMKREMEKINQNSSRVQKTPSDLLPVVTPKVHNLAKGFFLRSELIVGHEIDAADDALAKVCDPHIRFRVHPSNPTKVEWGTQILDTGFTKLFKSVKLDGIEYFVSVLILIASYEY
jgi:hypothetical protein